MTEPSDFRSLIAICEAALDSGDATEIGEAIDKLEQCSPVDMPIEHIAALAGLLVDLGSACRLRSAVERGKRLFEDHRDRLEPVYGSAQIDYNIGNAFKVLYDLERAVPGWSCTLAAVAPCLEAKAHYWRAIAGSRSTQMPPQYLTNLGNALDACGRVVDALHYYDRAIGVSPKFGMAHLNRGVALQYLNDASGSYSIKMLHEIYKAYDAARTSESTEPQVRHAAHARAEFAAKVIREHGHEPTEDPHELQQNEIEQRNHDVYWHWCLEHSLALSEHALYCRCAGARRDDLSILTPRGRLAGAKVPHMELLLNRIKSEYCLARALHFQAVADTGSLKWHVAAFEGTYTELFDGEEIGVEPEFLRTSFRLCFGILDRIARGLCSFFSVSSTNEAIYFESFWRPGGRDSDRWRVLSAVASPNLAALYGLAKDLNERAGGEWSRLKRYRNLFEHEFCAVRADPPHSHVPRWLADAPITTIDAAQMEADALEMLRFTRAAMFHFAFLVREQSRDDGSRRDGKVVEFGKKPIGKE